ESWKQLFKRLYGAAKQSMRLPRLWRAGPGSGARWQLVTLEDDHLFKMTGKGLRGRQPAHTSADYNSALADTRMSNGISVVHCINLSSWFHVMATPPST